MSTGVTIEPLAAGRGRPFGVLMVCLGNICRSPLAEHLLRRHARAEGLDGLLRVESRGTGGWHEGGPADPRTIAVAARFGWELVHTARQVRPRDDLPAFDLILAMDKQNRRDLLALGADPARVRLMRSFDPAFEPDHAPDVPDPYHGGEEGFVAMYRMLDSACLGLARALAPR